MTSVRTVFALWLVFWALGVAGETRAASSRVTGVDDLHSLAEQARSTQMPILLVVSQRECPYCELLKREILDPMLLSGDYDRKVIIRELLIDSLLPIRDFSGDSVQPETLAQRYRAWLTPTLLFLDYRGREIAERIVGINSLEFYGYYVDAAIELAHSRLEGSGRPLD